MNEPLSVVITDNNIRDVSSNIREHCDIATQTWTNMHSLTVECLYSMMEDLKIEEIYQIHNSVMSTYVQPPVQPFKMGDMVSAICSRPPIIWVSERPFCMLEIKW